jgi:putative transposase
MQIGHRFRCYPNAEQERTLLRWIGCQRFIYNAKVGEDRYFRSMQRRFLALTGLHRPIDQKYAHFISDETAFLREVPSHVLRNGVVRWKQSYSRHFAGLGGRPKLKKKHGRQSVWLTSELFRFVRDAEGNEHLEVGTRSRPVGRIRFHAHQQYLRPASIYVAVENGRWHLSFSTDDGRPAATEAEVLEQLRHLNETQLAERTFGGDLGVATSLTGSDGQVFHLSELQEQRLATQERRARRWQRIQARRQMGSKRHSKAKHRVAKYRQYGKNVRWDLAHQTSHRLVTDARYSLYVFEALKVQNMTRKPKAQQDEQGRWMRNGARSKAGLNASILKSAWGRTRQFTTYKALRAGKLAIKVDHKYSSQECGECGHTHPDNRPSQAEFVCQACGHRDHADLNAARVIKMRGVRVVLSGDYQPANQRRARIRKDLGAGGPEVTLGESSVRRGNRKEPAQRSGNRETPTTAAAA